MIDAFFLFCLYTSALLEKMDRSHCLILMLEHWQIYFIYIYPTSQSYNSCQVRDLTLAYSQTTVTSSSVSSYQFCQKHVCFVFCKCLREIFNKPNWPSIPNCKSMQHERIKGFVISWSHWMASKYIAFDHICFPIDSAKK